MDYTVLLNFCFDLQYIFVNNIRIRSCWGLQLLTKQNYLLDRKQSHSVSFSNIMPAKNHHGIITSKLVKQLKFLEWIKNMNLDEFGKRI
jgi:hypothetical protein